MTARAAVLAATVAAALSLAAPGISATPSTRTAPRTHATPSTRTAPRARATLSARIAPRARATLSARIAPSAPAARCPVLLAHQGYTGSPDGRGRIPADSVPAISSAVRHGARVVELDVRWSTDSVPVVIHNATVNATTRRHGQVAHYRAAELLRMRLRSAAGLTRDRLPSLQRALRTVAAGQATAVVEIKTHRVTPAQATSFDAAVYAAGATGRVSVHSFYRAPLAALRYPATLLTEAPATAVRGEAGVDMRASIVTPGLVRQLHAAHRTAGAWTSAGSGVSDGPAAWSALARDGVDRIITGDTPDYRAWCASRQG